MITVPVIHILVINNAIHNDDANSSNNDDNHDNDDDISAGGDALVSLDRPSADRRQAKPGRPAAQPADPRARVPASRRACQRPDGRASFQKRAPAPRRASGPVTPAPPPPGAVGARGHRGRVSRPPWPAAGDPAAAGRPHPLADPP